MLKTLYVLVDRYEENEEMRRRGMMIDMVWPRVLIVLVESSAWTRESLRAYSEYTKVQG